MHRIFRHFVATTVCVMIFSATGTIEGFLRVLQRSSETNLDTSLAFTWLLNFVFICVLSLVVLAPLTSIADYLFTHRWSFPFYMQIPVLAPLLIVYLLPWSLFFGRFFLVVLTSGSLARALPLLVYWTIFQITNRNFTNS